MVFADLVAGTMAGFGICAVGHPFDTLKVLMQMDPSKYKGMLDAGSQVVRQYGPTGLYRGVASPLVGMGIFNAVQFAVFGAAKSFTTGGGKNNSLNNIAGAAAMTGLVVAFVEGPQDLFKCQMQTSGGKYKGTYDCMSTIVGQRGVAGALQGINETMARNLVGVTAYFYFYEMTRQFMAGSKPVESLSFFQVMFAGGCGGVGYWALCYPLDIVKTAIQCDDIDPAKRKYKGAFDAASKLWAEGGVKRFSAGLVPALSRSFPANAVGFAIYEATKAALSPAPVLS